MNPFMDSVLSLRRRSVWEAADTGVLLWRKNFVYFIPFFALPVWITACALRLLPEDIHYLPYLILWWLKPLFDRPVLHVVSRRFFGDPSSSRYRELRRGLWGSIRRGLLGDLLWRRFSPARSARMPIRVLERIGRKQFRQRKESLALGGLNFSFLINFVCLAVEGVLLLGEMVFFRMTVYMFFPTALSYLADSGKTLEIILFAAFCFNYILVESLSVCMGFGLYINSRVEVEGWDLQLLFQKFSGREEAARREPGVSRNPNTAGKAPNGSGFTALLVLCLFTALAPAARADSEDGASSAETESAADNENPAVSSAGETPVEPLVYFPEDFPSPDSGALEDLETIRASPDFGSEKESWGIRLKRSDKKEERKPRRPIDLSPWLQKVRYFFSMMLRFLLVAAIAGFLVFVFYRFRKQRGKGAFRSRGAEKSYVNPLFSPESPESLFVKAEGFFGEGFLREAWAACLSGSIGACAKYRSLSFPKNATEYGCLSLVRSALPSEARGFGELLRNWILLAYGGRLPAEGAFERALAWGRSLLKAPAVPGGIAHNAEQPPAANGAAGGGAPDEA